MQSSHSIVIDGLVGTATKHRLLGAFASGRPVSLFDAREQSWVHGHIQGVRVESGYRGEAGGPTHFLVDILRGYEVVADIFVRTID